MKTVLLRPLPYSQPERLVQIGIRSRTSGLVRDWVPMRDIAGWQARSRSFERTGAHSFALPNLLGAHEPEALYGSRMTSDMFVELGVRPASHLGINRRARAD